MKILISYNNNKGSDTIIWLKISGGVIIADTIKIPTKAYLLYSLNDAAVTNPNLARKNIIIGNSNINPEAITDVFTIPI